MASLPHASGKDKAKELRKRIDDSLDTLAKAVDDVRASDTFRRYLEVQARFHKYSRHNCMLIAMQRPDASRVAGYRTWQKLGRQVCKGEHGIMIFAPCPWKRETREARGWSQEELAYRCGVHRTYVGGVERGEYNVTILTLRRFTKALRISLRDALRGIS
jgi:DNA-binding XRE family transcriptional regulator